jgi:putative addiction module component (TIGR02574 family)
VPTPAALRDQIAHLSALDRLALVESILLDLDTPAPELDTLWGAEAERRLQAYQSGQVQTISASEALAKYTAP